MNIAASMEGLAEWVIVDGNRETEPYRKMAAYLSTGDFGYVGFTVMPGPQLKQAAPFAQKIKENFPAIAMIWGGYFPTNQYKAVLESGYVDFVINGPGDHAFPAIGPGTGKQYALRTDQKSHLQAGWPGIKTKSRI
jgi:anaerobic magnesium-protoporphyrin IX monomethyl ester cyclase